MSRVEIRRDWQPVDALLRERVDFAPLGAALDLLLKRGHEAARLADAAQGFAGTIQPAAVTDALREWTDQIRGKIPMLAELTVTLIQQRRVMYRIVRRWRVRVALLRFRLWLRWLLRTLFALATFPVRALVLAVLAVPTLTRCAARTVQGVIQGRWAVRAWRRLTILRQPPREDEEHD
jgi:hypothetical protein